MISLSSFQIFNNHISNLKQTSIDDSDNSRSPQFMTDSLITAINYDAVKDEYVRTLQLSEIPKSNDALFDDGRGHLVFVEFKNGKIGRRKQFEIRKKIYDSVLIFSDITSEKISDIKTYVNYILVYNESANAQNHDDETLLDKIEHFNGAVPSLTTLQKTISNLSKEEFVCFGISAFKNYCFNSVHTYTESEFKHYLGTLFPSSLP